MRSAMGRISSGRLPGTPRTHSTSSARVMVQASSREMPRSFGARAAADRRVPLAVGADLLLQKLFHPLHALFVLHLSQGVFHGVDGVEIGKIQLSRLIGVFRLCRKCVFSRRGRERRSPFPARSGPGRARRCARPSPGKHPSSATTSGCSREQPRPRRWSGNRPAPACPDQRCGRCPCRRTFWQAPWELNASSSAEGA